MEIWFKNLVSMGVLLIGELDSKLIYRPVFSHQGSTNHQGADVIHHFERCTYFLWERILVLELQGTKVFVIAFMHPIHQPFLEVVRST